MERIETINLKTETDALEAGHGITLYTFDEYGRLMHYAHIVASTPKEREDGYADYFLTIFKGGDDMRRFDPDDGNDYPNFESIIESIKTIWSNTPIWWERDGSVPGMDARDVPGHAEHTERVGDFQNRKPFAGASAPVRLPCGKQQRNIKKPADIIGITRKETCHASSEHGSAHQH